MKLKERRIYEPGNPNSDSINEQLPFTRRIAKLKPKQQIRDSKIAQQIIHATDVLNMPELGLKAFIAGQKTLSDPTYWELLRALWLTAGKRENYDTFRGLFRSKHPHRDWFMTLEDDAFLQSLPEEFEVYRAAYPESDDGLSWTLDRDFAERYAEEQKRVLVTRRVKKREVFAYISRRGESEILILEAGT
jgi:hypothetical protein